VELSVEQPDFPARAQRLAESAGTGPLDDRLGGEAERAITALYQTHAVGLIRLAVVMLGTRGPAEDIVQEAFCGLYRRWGQLEKTDRALYYLRASVLNGCRSEFRARVRNSQRIASALPGSPQSQSAASAEELALIGEEHREVLAAIRRLPRRQREALVLRYFLDLPDFEIARSMGITLGTVKSTTSKALAALARMLGGSR
jgi:RNA polymerase sigma-70 factor (sigma-E family)